METLTAFLCLSLALASCTLAAPINAHETGGIEHIVLVDNNQPIPPRVEEVMERLALHSNHPDVRRVFNNSAFTGFSATMQSHCLEKLAQMTDVSLVEQVTYVPRASIGERDSTSFNTRLNAPWGLQRISSATAIAGNSDALDFTYFFANQTLGTGADIYMIDTGIYAENNIFGGRAKMLWSFDNIMTDDDGHGTHTAGTAGGNILGVASDANIFGMKALDKDGGSWSSDVVGAIDKVIQYHDLRKAYGNGYFRGSVLSMSLAASGNVQAMNSAINHAIRAGVHSVVAAGNDGTDACLASPASDGGNHGPAITVGAINIDGQRADFSNYGDCVDVYAPGVGVISAWIGGKNMINQLSGTSMATPHVTGIVAYAMANETLANDPALMKEWIRMTALKGQDGSLVANNGVKFGGDGEGFLGKVEDDGIQGLFEKRSLSTLNAKTACQKGEGVAKWLCKARGWTSDAFKKTVS